MLNKEVLNEIGSKVTEILEHSPAKDVEKNLKIVLSGAFARLDLVTREEFDVQTEVLKNARAQLKALEARIETLELANGAQKSE